MRLLHIVTAWPRDPEDVITPWLTSLCDRLDLRGHTVEVLAPSYAGLQSQRTSSLAIHRYRYAPARWERLTHDETAPDRIDRHPAYALAVPGMVLAASAAARRLARKREYDVVHVHWAVPNGVPGWVAVWTAGGRAALVTTFYGAEIRFAERRFPVARRFLRWYCRRSHLIAISKSTRESLRPYTDREIEIIPYGVPFSEESVRAVTRRPDVPLFLFVGRLVARKGVDRLLQALSRSMDRQWRLEIVGFGPERDRLLEIVGDLGLEGRVEFLGRVDDERLARAYREASCLVLPATVDDRADTEGLGVVLLEAMAHGLPVIATRRGGITDIVVDGETGFLVDDEIEEIASGIRRFLENPESATAMGDAGRRRVQETFGWDIILDRLEAVYARGPVVVDPASVDEDPVRDNG